MDGRKFALAAESDAEADRAKRREVFIVASVMGFCFPSGFFCNMVKDKNDNGAITEPLIKRTIEVSPLALLGRDGILSLLLFLSIHLIL